MPRTEASPQSTWRLADWLAYQERLHPKPIALGLDRVRAVALRLGLLPARAMTLTIGGTNGKGSSVTLAAGIYQAAGYRVGCYTSPHLLRYNERIAIDGCDVDDEALCAAFVVVEQSRADVELTYFEFGTLAALWLFREARCEVQVLEVGLGGRLDAINIVDADCALVTNIGLDHTDWLGADRDSIGYEKAGIMRPDRPVVCVEANPPARLIEHAKTTGALPLLLDREFGFRRAEDDWSWRGEGMQIERLPPPALAGAAQYANAAGVIAMISTLRSSLPVPDSAIREALIRLRLRGRYEKIGNVILDVAHNVEAAQALTENLRAEAASVKSWLVLGMLADKPVEGVCRLLAPLMAGAFFGGLPGSRGLNDHELARRAAAGGLAGVAVGSIDAAFRRAQAAAGRDDRIVVCGSFLTVAAVARLLDE